MAAIVSASEAGAVVTSKYGYKEDKGQRPGAIPHDQISNIEWDAIEQFRDMWGSAIPGAGSGGDEGSAVAGAEGDNGDIDFNDPYLTYDVLLRFLRARELDLIKGR